MTDITALIERLTRAVLDSENNYGDAATEALMREAASALYSLEAARKRLGALYDERGSVLVERTQRIADLEAENKRLTEGRDERLCRLHAPFGLGEENTALRSRINDLERVLRRVVGVLGSDIYGNNAQDAVPALHAARALLVVTEEPQEVWSHATCLCGHGQNEHHDADEFTPPDPSFCGGCEDERPGRARHRFVLLGTATFFP